MKLIEKLNADYNSGILNEGLTLNVLYSTHGNIYNYCLSGELYMHIRQASNAHRIFDKFIKDHQIKITDITPRKNYFEGIPKEYSPTEKAPSFKVIP